MVSAALLNIVMLIELGLLAVAVVLFFAHGVWLGRSQRRLSRLTGTGRDSLARLVTRGAVNVEETAALQSLPQDVQVIAFFCERLTALANESADMSTRAQGPDSGIVVLALYNFARHPDEQSVRWRS
jgi:hypothetical protein